MNQQLIYYYLLLFIVGASLVEEAAGKPLAAPATTQQPAVKWEWSSDTGWEEFGSVESSTLTKGLVGGLLDVMLQVRNCGT